MKILGGFLIYVRNKFYGYSLEMPLQVAELASVAQSDACLIGDQEVADSIPIRPDNILSWRVIMKYFLQSVSAFS